MAFRRRIVSNFKLQGLQLTNEATSFLADVLDSYKDDENIDNILDEIIEAVHKQPLKSSLIDHHILEGAVEECNKASDSNTEKALVIIDAFHIPPFTFNQEQKKFLPLPKSSLKLFADASAKAKIFRERYAILYQRTIRHDLFSPPVVGELKQTPKFQLKSVEYLLGSSGLPDKVIVLGMLVQLKEGKFHLEDPSGIVEIDITQCTFHSGLFVESSIVLAEGIYTDKVFRVSAIGFPPIEPAAASSKYFGNINLFGGPSSISAKSSVKFQVMLDETPGAMIVVISDLFLDEPKVMEKLPLLFAGYSDCPPVAFVFMGNFSSTPYGNDRYQKFKSSFRDLASLMLSYPDLVQRTQFCFVPGSHDPGPANILPRPPIPSNLTSELTSRVPNVHFCSNPCRIQYCTREIVIFRDDILNKMTRHCVRFPSEGTDMANHFVKTILSQSHLSPLPLHSCPVYWMYDHTLRLYPLPDVVVIGDKCNPFTVTSTDCTVINPGSFPRNGFEFKVYIPKTGEVEDSKLID
jgi:DNA polymerase epsilon subunit 2